jgi:hypothetical protein
MEDQEIAQDVTAGVQSRTAEVLMTSEQFEVLAPRLAAVLDEFQRESGVLPEKIAAALQFFVGTACGSAGYVIRVEESVAQAVPIFAEGYKIAFAAERDARAARRAAANDAAGLIVLDGGGQ